MKDPTESESRTRDRWRRKFFAALCAGKLAAAELMRAEAEDRRIEVRFTEIEMQWPEDCPARDAATRLAMKPVKECQREVQAAITKLAKTTAALFELWPIFRDIGETREVELMRPWFAAYLFELRNWAGNRTAGAGMRQHSDAVMEPLINELRSRGILDDAPFGFNLRALAVSVEAQFRKALALPESFWGAPVSWPPDIHDECAREFEKT